MVLNGKAQGIPYLSAAKHDTKKICLHNIDQLSICIIAQHTVFVAVGARIVNPAVILAKQQGCYSICGMPMQRKLQLNGRAETGAICSRAPMSHGGIAPHEPFMLGACTLCSPEIYASQFCMRKVCQRSHLSRFGHVACPPLHNI